MRTVTAGAALVLALPVAGCGMFGGGPSKEDVADAFLNSLATGDVAGAAQRTTDPQQASRMIDATRQRLDPRAARARLHEVSENNAGDPVARFEMSWNFGEQRVWHYEGRAPLVRDGDQGWKVQWSPSVLHPRLERGQSLTFQEQRPDPAPVYDRAGNELLTPQNLVTVQLDPSRTPDASGVAGSLAEPLSRIDDSITQQSIMDGVRNTPEGQPYTVVTLRPDDYQQVREQIHGLPGVRFTTNTELASVDPDLSPQALSGVEQRVERRVANNAGWRVAVQDSASGAEKATLHDVPPRPVPAEHTTLDETTQRDAQQALRQQDQPAMLVAMRPSNGELVAVAQNDAADQQGSVALTGQYPPGSTFKIVTATAALSGPSGGGAPGDRLTMNTPVQCPGTKNFDGRVLPNEDEFDLGTVALHTAFAQSCNTTFAQLAVDQPRDALPSTARQLGLGVDFDMPGATTITGTVKPAADTVGRAENGIGQGTVLASPFGMALASASIAHGKMPVPSLLRGEPAKTGNAPESPPKPEVVDQVRRMMREVVTSGTGTALRGQGDVHGKTGTAQFGDGSRAHGWFSGYRGDLAFAVLVTDADSSTPAVDAADEFLAAKR